MLKADLRKSCLTRQRGFSALERLEKSQQIGDRFFQRFALEKVRFLHLFLSIEKNNEIETRFIYEKIWHEFPQIKTVIPRIDVESNQIDSIEFHSETQLFLNKWQILEAAGNDLVEANSIDIVLVPLLCVDRKGFRVGYGKGYYDRFLSNCRPDCLKIGLSYFPPIKEISDIHSQDVMLDYCITPDEIWEFQANFS